MIRYISYTNNSNIHNIEFDVNGFGISLSKFHIYRLISFESIYTQPIDTLSE